MTVLRRLTLLACAVAIVGCAERPSNENTDSTAQPNQNTVAQATLDKSSESTSPAFSGQESEESESKPAVANQSSNPVTGNTAALAAPSQSSQSKSEETSQQLPSTPAISEQSTFNESMTAAHRAVEQKHWEEASRLLETALQLKPSSAAAADLRAFVSTQQELLHQQDLFQSFTNAVQLEHWSEAREIAGKMKTPNSATHAQIRRSKTLTEAEKLVDRLLSEPNRLSRPSVQSEVSRLRSLTENVDAGKRVGEKLSRLNELSHRWTTPVVVNLSSDGKTTVTLRPGRSLGRFRSQIIQLMPGEYVLIGRRDGFREVRRALRLDPNSEPKTIEIKAKERF